MFPGNSAMIPCTEEPVTQNSDTFQRNTAGFLKIWLKPGGFQITLTNLMMMAKNI
jgi:hypothetical protein